MKLLSLMNLTKVDYIKSIGPYGSNCDFCGGINQPYMVQKSLWKEVFPKYNEYHQGLYCCIPCFEEKLGGDLMMEDFLDCPINQGFFDFNAEIYCSLKKSAAQMKCYFYRVRIYESYSWGEALKGIVYAESTKIAKLKVAELLKEETTIEIIKKKNHEYINGDFKLTVIECTEYWENYWTAPKTCKECACEYIVIDYYRNGISASGEHCSEECRLRFRLTQRQESYENYVLANKHPAIIYKITHKPSNQIYIGQTLQAFTLRWYQHFFHAGETKFHKLIKGTSPTEWTFEVQEIITDKKDQNFINQRNCFWPRAYPGEFL